MSKTKHFNLSFLISLVLFSVLLFSSCSSVSKSIYNNDYPLTLQKAFSRDSSYSILIPKGWFYSYDNKYNSSDIFLLKKDIKASLNIVPIHTDSKIDFDLKQKELINYSKVLKEAEQKSKLIEIGKPEFFEINNIKCAAYQYYNNLSLPVRTIIFDFNNRFFELNAYITDAELNGKLIPDDIYIAQNTILSSLKKEKLKFNKQ